MTGLYAAFIVGLVSSLFGGRPGMISGATGAISVVLAALVVSHGEVGVEVLFPGYSSAKYPEMSESQHRVE
jgi:SulP family sulfate permease